jgi:hypothetical protein
LTVDLYEFFIGPLRHFYGSRLSIDLLLKMNEKGKVMNHLGVVRSIEHIYSNEVAARAVNSHKMAKIQTVGAAIGLLGGPAAAFFGAILTAAGWFAGNDGARRWLSATGSVLLFLTIPLIILGACFLDWMEKGIAGRGGEDVR